MGVQYVAKVLSVVSLSLIALSSAKTSKKKMKKKEYEDKGADSSEWILDALNGECPQTCSNGFMPAPKPRRRPFANGCTIPSFDQNSAFYGDHSHFDKCCNYHDVCYMSCGMARNTCDEEMKECLLGSCDRSWDKEECEKMARMFYMHEKFYGCPHYRASQKDLCLCFAPEEAHERVRTYASEFFQVYNQTHMLPKNVDKKYFDREPDSNMHGELILRLYRKYPKGIEVVGRDGEATRTGPVYFPIIEDPDEDFNDEF